MFKFLRDFIFAFVILIKNSRSRVRRRNSKSQENTKELARNFLISPLEIHVCIIRLFIYLSFFRSKWSKRGERYHHRYWRGTRESSDSFRRVRNNLLNYRMPKVTSTRREDDAGERGFGEEGREDRRRGIVGVMVQIGRMGDSPRSGYFMESLAYNTRVSVYSDIN